jgi:hypothetical protein
LKYATTSPTSWTSLLLIYDHNPLSPSSGYPLNA